MKTLTVLLFCAAAFLSGQNLSPELYEKGVLQLESGEWQGAVSTFQSILDADNKNAQAWCGLGRALDGLNPGSAEAERAFTQAIRRNRRYGEAFYYLGVLWTHRPNRHKEAIEQLKFAVHFSPHLTAAWELLGYLHEQNANEKPAVLTFADALLHNPQNEAIYNHFLRTAFTYQYEKTAIKTLTKLLNVSENPGRVHVDLADAHRRLGDVEKAEAVFSELEKSVAAPACRGNLIKARILFDLKRDADGSETYWAAVDAISDSADRKAFYDDVCFIMRNSEYDSHRAMPNDSLSTFYHRFWRSRDPNLATTLNERLPEHYRRLTRAETEWRRSPIGYEHSIVIHRRTTEGGRALSAIGDYEEAQQQGLAAFRDYNLVGDDFIEAAHFPKALPRDRTVDDLAVVYIRHGEPTQKITPNFSGGGNNLTWIYAQTEKRPRLIFHFTRIGEHTGWVLEAIPGNMENLEMVHGRYSELQDLQGRDTRLSPAARGYAQEVVRENLVHLEQGMTTETTAYTTPEAPITVPYQYFIYKNDPQNEIDLFFLIHGGVIDLDTDNKVDVDEFLCILNDNWDEVTRHSRKIEQTLNLTPQQWAGSGFAMKESFPLSPGDYFTEFQLIDNVGSKRAIHNDSLTIPDYQVDQLMLSDIFVSGEIDESKPSSFERNGVPLNPHMFYGFPPNAFVGVYFEIYNLRPDEAGKTRYEISITLQNIEVQQARSGTVFGFVKNLFMDKRQVTSRFDSEGRTRDDYMYMNVQFPDRKSGRYNLIIRVKDVHSGQVRSMQTQITLL